jgi:PAS domain S-box-containing protein
MLIVVAAINILWIVKLSKTKKELKDKNLEYESIFNETLNTVAIFEENRCVDVNDSGLKILGYDTKDEIVGKHALEFTVEEYYDISIKKIETMDSTPYETVLLKKDGTRLNVLLKGFSFTHTKKRRRMVSFIDLTEIKEKERSLELSKERAEESTKTKSEFLANMSHEIRTPMNGILGMSYLALQTDLNSKQKHYIEKIEESAKSLLEIINDILDFSKIEAGKLTIEKTNFNLVKVIDQAINLIEYDINDKNLELIVNYDESVGKNFYGDQLRLGQILNNLLSNAIKFTDRGEIGIYISRVSDNYFRFEVSDTGIGISQEQQSKLFQLFSQADGSITRKYGGTGLGLCISKQIVQLLDGKIWVESQLGVGSRFIFEVYLQEIGDQEDIPIEKRDIIGDVKNFTGGKILLVEDNISNQEVVVGLLNGSYIDIDIANNGQEGIDRFRDHKYDLILMDLQMPIMNGYEATKIIREIDRVVPIVALTASATTEDVKNTQNIGMNEHLNKPIEVKKLYAILSKYLTKEHLAIKSTDSTLWLDRPKLNHIDINLGLKSVNGNYQLYIKIIQNFLNDYRALDLDSLDSDRLKRVLHTIKGLSGTIGANRLHHISKELYDRGDMIVSDAFRDELKMVIDELDREFGVDKKIKDQKLKKSITPDQRDELFKTLRDAVDTKQIKKCKPIIGMIDGCELSNRDKLLYRELKDMVMKYRFRDAMILVESLL